MSASQAERLRAMIEEDILALRLRPGERLDESRLAERYGTSRTPVREALRQLSSNGLVEIKPHKGASVARLGIRELVEVLEVMAELEGACGRLAAKSGIKADLDIVSKALDNCWDLAEKDDVAGYQRANEIFHDAIYAASRNDCLIRLTLSIRNRLSPYRRLQLERASRLKVSASEHQLIVQAIRDGNPDEADRLLQVHILNLGGEIRRLISLVSSAGWEHPASVNGGLNASRSPELIPAK